MSAFHAVLHVQNPPLAVQGTSVGFSVSGGSPVVDLQHRPAEVGKETGVRRECHGALRSGAAVDVHQKWPTGFRGGSHRGEEKSVNLLVPAGPGNRLAGW